MQRVRHDFETIDQPRTGAAEVRITVGNVNAPVFHGWQLSPGPSIAYFPHIFERAVGAKAATGDKQDVGLCGRDVFPAQRR
jgi:hypothetical protein